MAEIKTFECAIMTLTQGLLEVLEGSAKQKKTLIDVVMEEITDEEKIQKLKKAILAYNSGMTPCSKVKAEAESKIEGNNSNGDEMEIVTSVLTKFCENSKPYTELFDKITVVLRDQRMPPKKKVEEISDLLL